MLVHRTFHGETRDPLKGVQLANRVLMEALDVHFILPALPDMPGHKPQTQRQTFNTLQALLGEERSWAMGLGPGPDGAQPALASHSDPSGHFGKAPSEHSTTSQGLQRPKQKKG